MQPLSPVPIEKLLTNHDSLSRMVIGTTNVHDDLNEHIIMLFVGVL